MSQAGVINATGSGGGPIDTLSAEGGAHEAPVGGNFNFSGSIAGGSAANGAILFSGLPGEINAAVQVDGTTIEINASNQLEVMAGAGTIHIIPDIGVNVTNGTFNFNGLGGLETNGAAANHLQITDKRFTTQYVVDPSAVFGSQAEYTTIQAAVTAANAAGGGNVFVRAGTYTENVTVPSNVTITGYSSQTATASSSQTIISGSLIFTGVTNVNICNMTIVANGATAPIQFTGAGITVVSFVNCTLAASAVATITCTNSNAASVNVFYECNIFQDGAFPFITQSGAFLQFSYCYLGTSVGVTSTATPSLISGNAQLFFDNSFVAGGIQSTGSAGVDGYFTQFASATIPFNHQSTGSSDFSYCQFIAGGTSAAININPGSSATVTEGSVYSASASHAITGSGTFNYDILTFLGTGTNSTIDPALTVNLRVVRPFSTANSTNTTALRGLCSFNSANFTVDSTGYVSLAGGLGETWIDQGSSITVSANTGYFTTAAITLTLPVSPSQGNICEFFVDNAGALVIQASAGQTIRIDTNTSSVAGTATSTAQGNSIKLVYRASDSLWACVASNGSWTLA